MFKEIESFRTIEHKNQSLNKFIHQFRDKKNIVTLINIISEQLNDLEEVLAQLNDNRGIDKAQGPQLDVLGIYKNVLRLGLQDEEYRQSIKNQIALDSSNGSSAAVVNSSRIILGGKQFQYSESYPARCEVFVAGAKCNQYQYNLIKKTTPIGVSLGIRFCEREEAFGFNGNDISKGYGSINNNEGGGYASIIGDVG